MFAGEDMSAVTKFAGGGDVEEADEDDGKSDFLKEIERSVPAHVRYSVYLRCLI
jgi:hypothetical protein